MTMKAMINMVIINQLQMLMDCIQFAVVIRPDAQADA